MLARLLLLPFAAIIVFTLGVVLGVRGADLPMLGLATLTLTLGVAPAVLDQGRRPSERHLFLSFYALVFAVNYSVPVFTYYIPAIGPVDAPGMARTNLLPGHVVAGQIAALVGYLSLLVGYASPFSAGISRGLPRSRSEWPPGFTVLLGVGMIPVGLAVNVAGRVGMIPPAFGTGVIGIFALAYVYANCLLTIAVLRYKLRLPVVFLAVNIAFSFVYGILTGTKMNMLVAPAAVVLTATLLRGRIRARWLVLGFAAVLLVYPLSDFVKIEVGSTSSRSAEIIRNPVGTLRIVGDFLSSSRPGEYFVEGLIKSGGRLDALGVTSVLVRDTPGRSPYQHGRTLGLIFVAFVPRALWPDKPGISLGQWITTNYGSGAQVESSTGPSQLGEFYINFGYFGVIAGMLFLGFVMRLAHETLLRHPATTPALLAGVVLLFNLALKFTGSVAATYASVILLLAPIGLAHVAVRTFLGTRPVGAAESRAGVLARGESGESPPSVGQGAGRPAK